MLGDENKRLSWRLDTMLLELEQEQEHQIESSKDKAGMQVRQTRRWACACVVAVVVLLAVVGIVALCVRPIAQSMLAHSRVEFASLQLADLRPDSASVSISGTVSNAGPMPSVRVLPMAVDVLYNNVVIGSMNLSAMDVVWGKAEINTTAPFAIANPTAFRSFATDMLSVDHFTWRIRSKATVEAFHNRIYDLDFDKEVVLSGKTHTISLRLHILIL